MSTVNCNTIEKSSLLLKGNILQLQLHIVYISLFFLSTSFLASKCTDISPTFLYVKYED